MPLWSFELMQAPKPTFSSALYDVQRAIWKEVHSIPDKPITIEFDPKKDK